MAKSHDDSAKIEREAPGGVGLLILDMINDFAFEGGEDLQAKAEGVASTILRLRDEADRLGVPVVYVNDNYGQWHSEKPKIVEACAAERGGSVVRRVAPRQDDFFVIKPPVGSGRRGGERAGQADGLGARDRARQHGRGHPHDDRPGTLAVGGRD